ncbi:MAG: DNA helicase RecQ [Sebaldella sp.]|nr:DNA helicase RecQ [Sebaldella sp.]
MSKAITILKKYFGYDTFRRGQEDVINSIVSGRDILAIMPTGGGKSVCYQIPALMLDGLTIVISPLISLMKDQVDTLNELGIKASFINSTLSDNEIFHILTDVKNDKTKILYIAPERLNSLGFINLMRSLNVSMIAVDESHCVSQWGHDFRKSYRFIPDFIKSLKNRPIVTAFTATATKEVREDILRLLELRNPESFITGFDRENLKIKVIKGAVKKKYIIDYVGQNKGQSGIIYCSTRKEVDSVYELLGSKGHSITRYHGGLGDNERKQNQEDFIYDNANIIVATNAFGMGIDKPNVRYVIHYNMPRNIENYYQEIGRAGRDGLDSECILLYSPRDVQTQKFLIENSTEDADRKNHEYKKLRTITDFVHTDRCLRNYILDYFEEGYVGECGRCSNCDGNYEMTDRTVDAQKVLSCVYRMKRPYGINMIVDVLKGSKNQKLLGFKLNELSTYGIMKEYPKEELKSFVNTLIAHSYLDYIDGEYPVVTGNNLAMRVLRSEERVLFKNIKKTEVVFEYNELFEKLRELRREFSQRENVPSYIVFGDNSLKEMSVRYPQTYDQFLEINGVGNAKVEKYGTEFLRIIKDYVADHDLHVVWNSNSY